jgi:hypothetical protein
LEHVGFGDDRLAEGRIRCREHDGGEERASMTPSWLKIAAAATAPSAIRRRRIGDRRRPQPPHRLPHETLIVQAIHLAVGFSER